MAEWIHETIALTTLGIASLWVGCNIVWFIWRDDIDHSPIPCPKFYKEK